MSNDLSFDFTATSVVVTGGTSGIGRAVALGFARAGASVIVTGTRASADEYDTDLSMFGFRQLDLRDPPAVDTLAERLGTLDVLVNNAGANFAVDSTSGPRRGSPPRWSSTSRVPCVSPWAHDRRSRRAPWPEAPAS